MPSISVITICFNNLSETVATCNSVDIQQQKPFEHIIIDGSSNPGIKNYLEQNNQPSYRKWICEPDEGIADAFNKGVIMATGEIVVMLNSGDTFFGSLAILTVTKTFDENPHIQWVHGKYQLIRGNEKVVIGKPFEKGKLYRGMRSICHQTMFIKKELHHKYGLYNKAEKIGMDYDFLCRIADEPFIFVKPVLGKFCTRGYKQRKLPACIKRCQRYL